MRRLIAPLLLVAGLLGFSERADAAVWNCWSKANGSGTAFTGRCSGTGAFYVRAVCRDADGNRPYTKTGSLAYAPNGYSTGNCKMGWHPGSTWISTP